MSYAEGVFVGYRGYEKQGTKPQFAFGHGLSYTTFKFDDLTVTPATEAGKLCNVSFVVTNSGSRAGAAVSQLDARSFAFYDVVKKQWRVEAGTFQIMVGSSSDDIALRAEWNLPRDVTM